MGYRRWLTDQRKRLAEPEIARYAPAGELALDTAADLADRLDRAIELLGRDATAREAFRFANQAMALQRVRSEVTRRRLADQAASLDELLRQLDVPEDRSWRPFQLAFVLLCLPGLTDPAHPDAHRDAEGQAQLLFFPTGGGKTEAYLGLTAFTLALRRLQGVVGDGRQARDGSDGVAVLMRYTLRLLTAQQFQRGDRADLRLRGAAARTHRIRRRTLGRHTVPSRALGRQLGHPQQLRRGPPQHRGHPWHRRLTSAARCSSRRARGADRGYRQAGTSTPNDKRRRILLYCSDPEGDCVFTRRRSPDEGLPVLVIDEEIYRHTPSLIIGTVDKFAQLPWKAATGTLFGAVDQRCARHGWLVPDTPWCTGTHQRSGTLPRTTPQPAMRLRPPDLIIQDELHLIADALGSMVGLYETAIDCLCTREQDGSWSVQCWSPPPPPSAGPATRSSRSSPAA